MSPAAAEASCPGEAEGRLISQIVIVGGGSAGWMAAALLSRLLRRRIAITLIESDAIGTVGVGEATIPPIRQFNALLGVDEASFLSETCGTYKLGIEFAGWGRPGARYMHAFGPIGQQLGILRLHHYWLQARARRAVPPLDAFSLNAVMARAGKFSPGVPNRPNSPLSQIVHAYHFDAGLYAAYLRRLSEQRGVDRVEGRIIAVRRDPASGEIRSVELEGGRSVEGDFFIDCSGFASLLIGKTLGANYDDWSAWLPCDRAVAVPCARSARIEPYTRATARAAGWQWRIPLTSRLGNGLVYSSAAISDEEAADTLLANLDGEPAGSPRFLRFTPGRRRQAWKNNCVAIGLAAGFLEPLESTSLHLVQSALLRLVALFPARKIDPATVAEYNTQTAREYDHVRDFVILHYKANQRQDSDLWRQCRSMDVPDTLKERMEIFLARGGVFRRPDELFAEESWIQVMLGQGLWPHAPDPLVGLHEDQEIDRYLEDIAAVNRRCAAALPAHEAALCELAQPASRIALAG